MSESGIIGFIRRALTRLFHRHEWEWWLNTRDPKSPKQNGKARIRYDASIWFCRKCRKEQTRGYAHYG